MNSNAPSMYSFARSIWPAHSHRLGGNSKEVLVTNSP
jgi:hypothetical protein